MFFLSLFYDRSDELYPACSPDFTYVPYDIYEFLYSQNIATVWPGFAEHANL